MCARSSRSETIALKRARFIPAELKVIVHFGVSERAVAIRRINRFDYVAANGVSKVKRERYSITPLIIAAHIVKRRQAGVPIRRATLETKSPRLIRAAAGIPQVRTACQPQAVNIAPHR